jgi:hypothetical protein
MIPFVSREAFEALARPVDGFPLCHPDLSTSNIFVDGNLNITCIIDWAFASTVPVSTAIMTPGLPHPRDDTEPVLDSAFRSGFIADYLHDDEAKLEPRLWECTRRAWLFTRLVLLDGLQDYYYFKELYTSVYKPAEEVNISALFKRAQKEDELVELAEELADDEEWAPGILDEEEYFAMIGAMEKPAGGRQEVKLIGIERRAIARKITIVSGLSQDFVADKRLWRWIEEMKRDLV